MPIHARIKAVKDTITEKGSTANDEIILECADQAGGDLESEFIYLISDTPEFDLQAIQDANPTDPHKSNLDWFIKLNNQYTELLFWMKTNPSPDNKNKADAFIKERIPAIKTQRFQNHPARTR